MGVQTYDVRSIIIKELCTLHQVDAPGNRSACPSIYTNLLSFRSSSSSIAINIPQTSSFSLQTP
ncbi:uncharacterized protein N7487_005862 [Penicillium crustosum]|uniref:uncharacterized protein n=1 Tax=Penicillium crustosum TaxID=36656 RepID=UPI0023881A08|nr:uncharacterized protein N7487_005862 [Penicillium crustosum]KAJ5411503.1 hypothetical protein N7487_005862 [Penicillium crustosum]